jgi:hypothetical protein
VQAPPAQLTSEMPAAQLVRPQHIILQYPPCTCAINCCCSSPVRCLLLRPGRWQCPAAAAQC